MTSGRRAVSRLGAVLMVAATAACRQDMHDQPSYQPLEASSFFQDGAASRPLPPNTVARGQLKDDTLLYTGKVGDEPAAEFPFALDASIVARGRVAYDAFCSHCHGLTGAGDGIVVQRGYTKPPPLYDARLKDIPVGHIYDVITNGFGAMPDHAAQIKVTDRWAIVAYVRALQLSASGTIDDVPAAERGQLDQAAPPERGRER
jgi:mono/diheme cytochrome c family protein